ncbi:GNAT family N-acetyltransferase [Cognaticolwellia mytili]|uniref:GNAT family N-acetyltransferase n=1 Tax=Cognaticolwellia mytili TaxID=1888913 RepID=UPI000A1719B8|nr:GNAT family N-acetyltransferase [Cognaticolwellia mytili]
MASNIVVRMAIKNDHQFILALSPRLAEVAMLAWHTDDVIQTMQDNYIGEMLAKTSVPHTLLIAEEHKVPLGFIHVKEHIDEISNEACAMVTLLAISPAAQGKGTGQVLMQAAESWAKKQNYRLLHLEVFANNDNAQGFYQHLGFQPEMMTMVKPL